MVRNGLEVVFNGKFFNSSPGSGSSENRGLNNNFVKFKLQHISLRVYDCTLSEMTLSSRERLMITNECLQCTLLELSI